MGVAANQPGLVPEVKAASEIFKPNLVIEKPATLISGNNGGTPPLKWLHHAKALFTEGHTAWDCLLSVACAQIGQVMLTMPHSMALLGISEGIVVTLVAAIAGLWTMFLLVSLYLEMKARQIKAGQWYDASGHRRQVTQYHEVMGYFGGPILKYVSQLLIAVHLIGTGTSQVIACAGNNYSIDQSHSKRWYALVWGGILMLFTFVPTFRHFRVINIVALVGTAYTAWYIVTEAGIKGITPGAITRPHRSAQDFFVGSAVLGEFGHPIALEMADAMRNQGAFQWAYFFGWLWTLTLILPHSIAANLAWPDQVYAQDNIYSVLPHSIWKIISVWLMNIHQLVAFSLYVVPLLFMWEKLIRVHSKPWYIRLPLRLPVSLALYLIGVAFPFYGTINSLYKALAEPLTAFVFPAAVYTWVYRSQSARSGAVLKPWKFLRKANWLLIWILNISIIIVWLFGQFGFGVYFSSQKLHNNIRSFGVFAQCYQCKSSAPKLHAPALAPHAARNFTAGAYLAPAHAPYSVEASTFSSPFG